MVRSTFHALLPQSTTAQNRWETTERILALQASSHRGFLSKKTRTLHSMTAKQIVHSTTEHVIGRYVFRDLAAVDPLQFEKRPGSQRDLVMAGRPQLALELQNRPNSRLCQALMHNDTRVTSTYALKVMCGRAKVMSAKRHVSAFLSGSDLQNAKAVPAHELLRSQHFRGPEHLLCSTTVASLHPRQLTSSITANMPAKHAATIKTYVAHTHPFQCEG